MYGLAPIGYLSGAGLKVTESSPGGGRGLSRGAFNGIRRSGEVPISREVIGGGLKPQGLSSCH